MTQVTLLNRTAFMQAGNKLLASLRPHRRRLTLVLVEADELRDVEMQHGDQVALALRNAFASHALAITGELGAAAQTGPYEYTLMVPVVDEELCWRMIARELGHPPTVRVPLAARHGRPRHASFQPTCLVRTLAPTERNFEASHAELRGELAELKWHATDPGFLDTVPMEPEEAALSPGESALRRAMSEWKQPYDLLPATVPVPLGYV